MANPRYTGVPGFDISEKPDDPPPVQRSFIPKSNAPTVTLRGVRVPLNSDVGGALVTDLARNKEQLFSDAQVIEKYDNGS